VTGTMKMPEMNSSTTNGRLSTAAALRDDRGRLLAATPISAHAVPPSRSTQPNVNQCPASAGSFTPSASRNAG
jgi:hypothetical protein